MKRKANPLSNISRAAALGLVFFGLVGCSLIPVQAKEGQIYMAGRDGATITTYSADLAISKNCGALPGTIAYAERQSYVAKWEGAIEKWHQTLTTKVVHTGPGCGGLINGSYDFIQENPAKVGWTPIEDPEALKQAEARICGESGLRDISTSLDEVCSNQWGMKR